MALWHWRNVRIDGMGFVTGIAIDGSRENGCDIWIRTDVGSAYRLDRIRGRWIRSLDNIPRQQIGQDLGLDSLAIEPPLPKGSRKKVYIAASYLRSLNPDNTGNYSGEVLVSSDRGRTWQPTGLVSNAVRVEPANMSFREKVGERLVIDPNKPDNLWYGSYLDGLWRKIGAGAWQRITGGGLPDYTALPTGSFGFTFIAFDQGTGTYGTATPTVYIGVHLVGVYKSTDGGATWAIVTGLSTNEVYRGKVSIDGTLYVLSALNLSKISRPPGSPWINITPEASAEVSGLALHPTNANIVVVSTATRRFHASSNAGSSWVSTDLWTGAFDANYPSDPVNPTAPPYYQSYSANLSANIAIDPLNPNLTVWWVNGFGVGRIDNYLTTSRAFTWVMRGLEELDTNCVKCPPKAIANDGAELFVGTQDKIGFRMLSPETVPEHQFDPARIRVNPAFPWQFAQWGEHYPQPFPHVAGASSIAYCEKKPDYMACVGFHQWQYWTIHGRSQDNGKTWEGFPSLPAQELWNAGLGRLDMNANPQSGIIAMNCNDPTNMVWAATNMYPFYTKDGGTTWQQCKVSNPGTQPALIPGQEDAYYYWDNLPRNFGNSLSPWFSPPSMLIADRVTPGTFYYWSTFAFYRSVDGGATWLQTNSGLPIWQTQGCLAAHPFVAGELWFCNLRPPNSFNFGLLYRSTNGGDSFSAIGNVVSCELVAFGRGINATTPAIYIFGRVGSVTEDTMYKSEDMGTTWQQISDPSVQVFPGINYLEGDMRRENIVYMSVAGRGFMYGTPVS